LESWSLQLRNDTKMLPQLKSFFFIVTSIVHGFVSLGRYSFLNNISCKQSGRFCLFPESECFDWINLWLGEWKQNGACSESMLGYRVSYGQLLRSFRVEGAARSSILTTCVWNLISFASQMAWCPSLVPKTKNAKKIAAAKKNGERVRN
jgi:hypothetical protein